VVVVDSSVWVEFFRGRNASLVERLRALLDADEVALAAPVRLEIMVGAAKSELPRLRRVLSALPLLLPREATWTKLEGWVVRARAAGERFAVVDLLIAGIADDHGALLWSEDGDFQRMARLGLVSLHAG
jgi:predicted nucleic acid-binding protein